MSEQMLDMSVVRIDGDTQPRTTINPEIVQEYAEAMEAGVEFPPITVVHDGAAYWLVDGFHRFFAHRRMSRQQIKAEVITGELVEARWLSLAANKTHGVRRTPDDTAKAVGRALRMRPDLNDPAIAEHVGVSTSTVWRHRTRLDQQKAAAESATFSHEKVARRTGRDGKQRPARNRSRRAGGIAKNALSPVRTGSAPAKMTALNMPHDPIMGARTLIEVFGTDYLRALIVFLSKHLEGVSA